MSLRFIGQPFSEDARIGSVLSAALREPGMTDLWIATAWAKRSGISRIRSAVTEFARSGGTSEVIVGIDEGGATREGLHLSLEVFDQVSIYHDPGARTFHPKIYAVESDESAVLIVGSGNLTKGGLFTNYEGALVLDAKRANSGEWRVRDDVRSFFDGLLDAGAAVRRLDDELIEILAAEGWVSSEAKQNARRSAQSREREQQKLFGDPVRGLAGAPAPEVEPLPAEDEDEDSVLLPPLGADEDEPEETLSGTLGFWKELSQSDASHTSSPGQIIIPIGFRDFFPPLAVEKDETEGSGIRQSAAYFTIRFVDGDFEKEVTTARVILYEPADYHPRTNDELRFTFRDREVFDRLEAGDILVFTSDVDDYRVERRPQGSMGARYGRLP